MSRFSRALAVAAAWLGCGSFAFDAHAQVTRFDVEVGVSGRVSRLVA